MLIHLWGWVSKNFSFSFSVHLSVSLCLFSFSLSFSLAFNLFMPHHPHRSTSWLLNTGRNKRSKQRKNPWTNKQTDRPTNKQTKNIPEITSSALSVYLTVNTCSIWTLLCWSDKVSYFIVTNFNQVFNWNGCFYIYKKMHYNLKWLKLRLLTYELNWSNVDKSKNYYVNQNLLIVKIFNCSEYRIQWRPISLITDDVIIRLRWSNKSRLTNSQITFN